MICDLSCCSIVISDMVPPFPRTIFYREKAAAIASSSALLQISSRSEQIRSSLKTRTYSPTGTILSVFWGYEQANAYYRKNWLHRKLAAVNQITLILLATHWLVDCSTENPCLGEPLPGRTLAWENCLLQNSSHPTVDYQRLHHPDSS